MIKVTYNPAEFQLELTGHAGYAPAGSDIVCAAASILTMTLENMIYDHAESMRPKIYRKSGECRINCDPTKGNNKSCSVIFETIFGGFELLSLNYPENVQAVKIKGE